MPRAHNPDRSGASAIEFRCEGRRRCPSGTCDPKRVVGRPAAVVEESARRVRQDPVTDLEATPRPYAVHATSSMTVGFGRFCYAYYALIVGVRLSTWLPYMSAQRLPINASSAHPPIN